MYYELYTPEQWKTKFPSLGVADNIMYLVARMRMDFADKEGVTFAHTELVKPSEEYKFVVDDPARYDDFQINKDKNNHALKAIIDQISRENDLKRNWSSIIRNEPWQNPGGKGL